jgi:predicted AAA+ superfamily ATPase
MTFIPTHIKSQHTYIDRVKPFIRKNLVKVFARQRRVSKSQMLFQIMQQQQSDDPDCTMVYVNKKNLQFFAIKTATDLYDYVLAHQGKTGKTFVFIDEIQDIKDFQQALRSLVLLENLDLYCTGSNANLLSGQIAGHLSGRLIEIHIFSLPYQGFLQFHALTESDTSFNLYLKYGGLPYLMHLPLEDAIVFDFLKNIYNTIVYRDIINRYAVRNVVFLEQWLQFLAAQTGNIFSAKKISDFLKS